MSNPNQHECEACGGVRNVTAWSDGDGVRYADVECAEIMGWTTQTERSNRRIMAVVVAVGLIVVAVVAVLLTPGGPSDAERDAYLRDIAGRGVVVEGADRDALVDAGRELCRVVGEDAEGTAEQSREILTRAHLARYANQWAKISAAAAKTLC